MVRIETFATVPLGEFSRAGDEKPIRQVEPGPKPGLNLNFTLLAACEPLDRWAERACTANDHHVFNP